MNIKVSVIRIQLDIFRTDDTTVLLIAVLFQFSDYLDFTAKLGWFEIARPITHWIIVLHSILLPLHIKK